MGGADVDGIGIWHNGNITRANVEWKIRVKLQVFPIKDSFLVPKLTINFLSNLRGCSSIMDGNC